MIDAKDFCKSFPEVTDKSSVTIRGYSGGEAVESKPLVIESKGEVVGGVGSFARDDSN